MQSKKLTSTLLLFAVFIGFLWWGLAMFIGEMSAKAKDGETIIYSLLILGCALTALVAILKLPRKKQP